MKQLNRLFHADKGCCHKCGQTYKLSLVLYRRIHNCHIVDILAQVYNCVTVILKDYLHYILSYIVDIALYRSHDNLSLAYRSLVISRKLLFDNLEGSLRNLRCKNELRQEHLSLLKILADTVKRRYERSIDYIKSFHVLKHLSRESGTIILKPVLNSVGECSLLRCSTS